MTAAFCSAMSAPVLAAIAPTDWTLSIAGASVVLGILLFLFLVVMMAVVALRAWSEGATPQRLWWRTATFLVPAILLAGLLLWLLTDADPVEPLCSIRDITVTDPGLLKSYDTMMILRKGAPGKFNWTTNINESKAVCDALMGLPCDTGDVYRAWNRMAEMREFVEKLNTFPGLVDLTPDIPIDDTLPIISFVQWRNISQTYGAYVRVKTAQGDTEEAARELAKMHGVIRKALPYTATLVGKMLWIAIAQINIKSAHAILDDPRCTPAALVTLRDAFPPFSKEEISLRRVLLAEYLYVRGKLEGRAPLNGMTATFSSHQPRMRWFALQGLQDCLASMLFARNRSLGLVNELLRLRLEGAARYPPDFSKADAYLVRQTQTTPDPRNLAGCFLLGFYCTDYSKTARTIDDIKIMSDLLAIELGDRLGAPLTLPDYYGTGAPYARDETTGKPLSLYGRNVITNGR